MKWNRFLLPVMMGVAIIMGVQLYNQQHADNGQLTVSTSSNALVLAWRGQVEIPMATSMRRAFAQHKTTARQVIVDLNSQGGSLREGGEVIYLLDEISQSHELITVVRSRRICMSMCVPIFLQGKARLAAPDARFMFHEPKRFYDDGSEAKGFSFEREALTQRFFDKYFVNSAMDAAWRARLEAQWAGKDIYKSGQELLDERSNIVTRLVTR
jgi:ATP-dependent protease ClpP protease subunit